MKIQITDQIFEVDEKTLYDWIKLGRVPRDASVWSETLTDGQWQPVSELPPVRKLWDLDNDSERTNVASESENNRNELKTGQRFLKYPRRLPVITLILIVLNVAIFHPLELRLDCFFPRLGSPDSIRGLLLPLNCRRRGILAPSHKYLFACPCLAPSPEYGHTVSPWQLVRRGVRQRSVSVSLSDFSYRQ